MRRFYYHSLLPYVILIACIGEVYAQSKSLPATTQSNTAALIQQLGSDSAEDRDSAQKQLVDLGPGVAAELKKAADDSEDPEIRSRAAAALAQMKDLDSNGPSLITLHMKDAPVADVLKAFGDQSHTTFLDYAMANPRHQDQTLSVDADRKPFWEVMSDVSGQLNMCPNFDLSAKNTIRLIGTNRNWMVQSPHQIVGPYWINVASIFRQRSIELMGTPQIDDQFTVRFIVLPEPKLAVTQMSEFIVKEANDDAGHSLMPPNQMLHTHILHSIRQMNHNIETHLSYPDQAGKNIAILRGEVTVTLAQDIQQFQVDDVLGTPRISNPLTGCKIQATVTRQPGEMFRATIECTRQGMTDDQWSAMMNHLTDLKLEDTDGHALMSYQSSMSMVSGTGAETSFTATALFSRNAIAPLAANRQMIKTGDAKKLTWNVATSMKPVVIPVTFKDLPMP